MKIGFCWDSWAAATFGPPTRTTTTTRTDTQTIVTRRAVIWITVIQTTKTQTETNRFNLVDQIKILTMAGKNPDRHWKTTDYMMSGQLKKLEMEQTELLKTFDRHDADVKTQLAQKITMTAERVYRCFFETFDELEENRQQQKQLLKPKYLENIDADTERKLGERKNALQWLVEKVPQLKKIWRVSHWSH